MSIVKTLQLDDQFQTELSAAGEKLVVVYYSAAWCAPCKKMKPVIEALSKKHPNVVFLKLDVDACQETAISQGVTAMPTFAFHKNVQKIDVIQGADPIALEEKINQHSQITQHSQVNQHSQMKQPQETAEVKEVKETKDAIEAKEKEKEAIVVPGHTDLTSVISMSQCECMNESDTHPFANVFNTDDSYLESDCDPQLIMSVTFQQPVKIHSFRIKAPKTNGPKDVKIFINQPQTMGFDTGESNTAVQELSLTPQQLDGSPVSLQFVKFQSVTNFQMYVKNNQSSQDKTVVNYLGFIGTPIASTNMGDFRRVSGKKGEIS